MALVAIDQSGTGERMLGVSRLAGDPDGIEAEFAVLVGDPWQGRGIGAALMESCLAIAKERGFRAIWGIVLAENTQMLALGRKLGFDIRHSPGSGDYELRLNLDQLKNEEGD
jgi:acetyltransferase